MAWRLSHQDVRKDKNRPQARHGIDFHPVAHLQATMPQGLFHNPKGSIISRSQGRLRIVLANKDKMASQEVIR
jgi:hypothetical protein